MSVDLELPLLRGSERKDFKRCIARWWWSWRDGLAPKSQKLPLWFGTGIHLAFEQWYVPGTTRGRDLRETWSEYCDGVMELVRVEVASKRVPDGYDQVVMSAEGVGLAMLDNYLDTYGHDENWEILSPEQSFGVKIPRQVLGPDRDATPVARFHGTFDITARELDTGRIWLWDHKTAKSIKTNHLPLDDQAGGYWAVADNVLRRQGFIQKNERIHGILYNFLMKAPPDERPVDATGRATNKPRKEHFHEAIMVHSAETFLAEHGGTDLARQQWGEIFGPDTEKKISKLTLAQLSEMADDMDLKVLGDVSGNQPSPRFQREQVFRTSQERLRQIQHIADEVAHMNAVKDGLLPITKNPTRDCTWDCDFYNLCLAEENGGDTDMLIEAAYKVRDPYEAHREEQRGEF